MIPGRTGRSDGSAIVSDRGCSPRLRPCRVPLVLGTGLAPGSGCGARWLSGSHVRPVKGRHSFLSIESRFPKQLLPKKSLDRTESMTDNHRATFTIPLGGQSWLPTTKEHRTTGKRLLLP